MLLDVLGLLLQVVSIGVMLLLPLLVEVVVGLVGTK